LKPGIDLLGPVDEIFYDIYDRYEPNNDHATDGCFISTVSTTSTKKNQILFWFKYYSLTKVSGSIPDLDMQQR
jgi:Rab GDP dissociation inhibitor